MLNDLVGNLFKHLTKNVREVQRSQRLGAQAITGAFATTEVEAGLVSIRCRHLNMAATLIISIKEIESTEALKGIGRDKQAGRFSSPWQMWSEELKFKNNDLSLQRDIKLPPWENGIS